MKTKTLSDYPLLIGEVIRRSEIRRQKKERWKQFWNKTVRLTKEFRRRAGFCIPRVAKPAPGRLGCGAFFYKGAGCAPGSFALGKGCQLCRDALAEGRCL